MVASQQAMQSEAVTVTAEMTDSMAAHAADGDWERVEEIAIKLRAAIMQVPEHDRRRAILSAARSLENVQDMARQARHTLAGKLSAIRRGRLLGCAGGARGRAPRARVPRRPDHEPALESVRSADGGDPRWDRNRGIADRTSGCRRGAAGREPAGLEPGDRSGSRRR